MAYGEKGEVTSWRDRNRIIGNNSKLITIRCITDLNRCMAHELNDTRE